MKKLRKKIADDNRKITDLERVEARSVLTCESKKGVCSKRHGRNPATGKLVPGGEAVGTIAAQSIRWQWGTQLTLRILHVGGTAGRYKKKELSESKI
ncbi:MAG: hypothetical protein V8S95_04300 [Odoribacter sp.]